MKKVMLMALFIFACSGNIQRSFNFKYSISLEPTNNKKLELWVPIPQSSEVQTINNIKIDADGLDYTIEDEELHGNKYLYINHKNGTSAKKNILISFDVNRIEHQSVQYDDIDPGNYLGSYSVVPTGAFFSKIIEKNDLNKSNVRGIYDYVLSGMHYGKPKEVGDTYYNDPWLSEEGQYGDKAVNRDEVVGLYKKAKSENGNYTFGNGKSVYACDIGVGNCSDYH